MTYDLRGLRLHGLIERKPGARRNTRTYGAPKLRIAIIAYTLEHYVRHSPKHEEGVSITSRCPIDSLDWSIGQVFQLSFNPIN